MEYVSLFPKQCHLWTKPDLTSADLLDANTFYIVETITDDFHQSRRLIRCKDCGQLYLREFYEAVDWSGGDDSQQLTYIPVRSETDAANTDEYASNSLRWLIPRLCYDSPTGGPKRVYWVKEQTI